MRLIAVFRCLSGRDHIRITSSPAIRRAAGVRSTSDAERRTRRICEHLAQTRDRVNDIAEFLDKWLIIRTDHGYIASPGWDDELTSRDIHPTREDAVASVEGVGGALRPGRAQDIRTIDGESWRSQWYPSRRNETFDDYFPLLPRSVEDGPARPAAFRAERVARSSDE